MTANDAVPGSDHASLFFMSPMLAQIVGPDGQPSPFSALQGGVSAKLFPNEDKHRGFGSLYRGLATNIYKTKDGRFYQIHGTSLTMMVRPRRD